jgi:acyl carrier protein
MHVNGQMEQIIASVCELGKVSGVGPDDDFYAAGFSSINALDLLIRLETDCDVTIPDDAFIAARSPRALHELVSRLQEEQGR